MKIKNKAYDILKWISLIALDAIGVAYQSLSDVWNLPYGTQVMKTCSIISVLIGALIGISTYNYNKINVCELEEDDIEENDYNDEIE